MISPGERVFVDTGAWIALAETADPYFARAESEWQIVERAGARLCSSVLILVETFTFLQRHSSLNHANRWYDSLAGLARLTVLECSVDDVREARSYVERKEFHQLSLVDATSFVLMRKHRIRVAFAFDKHFAVAGFRYVT